MRFGTSIGLRAGIAAVAVAAIGGAAQASLLSFVSAPEYSNPGSYTGTIEWLCPEDSDDDESGTLIISLSNTTAPEDGGFLTGFLFRVTNDDLKLHYESGLPGWGGVSNVNAGGGFGEFDFGAAVDGNYNGGGNFDLGIAAGGSGTFMFSVKGDEKKLCELTAADFFDESEGYGFVARFRDFTPGSGGNDRVPGVMPSPGAFALAALSGLTARRRRR